MTDSIEQSIERMAGHMAVLNDELGGVQKEMTVARIDIAAISADVRWLTKATWFQITLLGSLLLAALGAVVFG